MANTKSETQKQYSIPENFIEGGRILNGTFKTRNFVEAIILGGLFALIALALPINTLSTRIAVVLSIALPPAALAAIGINDDALSVFLKNAIQWKKKRSIMIYNQFTQSYSNSPLDVMMAEEPPRDKLISVYEGWKNKQAKAEESRRTNFVYEFEEDSEMKKIQDAMEKANGEPPKNKIRFGKKRITAEELDLLVLTDEEPNINTQDTSEEFVIVDVGAYMQLDYDDDDEFEI